MDENNSFMPKTCGACGINPWSFASCNAMTTKAVSDRLLAIDPPWNSKWNSKFKLSDTSKMCFRSKCTMLPSTVCSWDQRFRPKRI